MLNEKQLIIIGVTLTLIGLLALYCILLFSELPVKELTAIAPAEEGNSIRVLGRVEQVRTAADGTMRILTLSEEVSRTAVLFANVNVTEGMLLDVEGSVEMYEGEPELVIERLESVEK